MSLIILGNKALSWTIPWTSLTILSKLLHMSFCIWVLQSSRRDVYYWKVVYINSWYRLVRMDAYYAISNDAELCGIYKLCCFYVKNLELLSHTGFKNLFYFIHFRWKLDDVIIVLINLCNHQLRFWIVVVTYGSIRSLWYE